MPHAPNDKATARSRFVNDRCTLGNHERRKASSAAVACLMRAPELVKATTVCAYVSFGTEPETGRLIEGLARRGITVLLPVLLADRDLDWARYEPGREFASGRLGLLEPGGERLGVDAVRDADVMIVPALAVSPGGQRLGRGGGSYDRVIARLDDAIADSGVAHQTRGERKRHRPWVCALLYDHELDAQFPVEPHDRPVDAACSAAGVVRFSRSG
jgi:5-formyltetrahydrofolate cyclo-ligase